MSAYGESRPSIRPMNLTCRNCSKSIALSPYAISLIRSTPPCPRCSGALWEDEIGMEVRFGIFFHEEKS